MTRIACVLAAVAAVSVSLTACGPREEKKGVDPTTVDDGLADKPGPSDTTPSTSVTQVTPGGAEVEATPMQLRLQQYLQSGQTAEQRFQFDTLRFEGRDQLRQDPNDSLTTLAALLNAHPKATVQIHAYASPGENQKVAADRGAAVAKALVQSGVAAARVTSSGSVAARAGEDRVELIVRPTGTAEPSGT